MRKVIGLLAATTCLAGAAMADDGRVVVGFATAETGFMQGYDKPAEDAAIIRIKEINEAGGLLGMQIEVVKADTKTDLSEGAKAGLSVVDEGADIVIVSCDYDFGAPAALAAESLGVISIFSCAESIKAGIPGVGPNSFSASVLAPVQGATMAEWSYKEKGVRTYYRLLDTWTEYNKGVCDGFDWMLPQLPEAKLVGEDTYVNDDPSIAAQISRIKALPEEPEAIIVCAMMPGFVSAIKQIRAAGVTSMILGGSAMDGDYWMSAIPDLSDFYVAVQGSVYGDDPNPAVNEFVKKYTEETGAPPATQYTFPGYILIDLWAKAVERAGTTETAAVVAELEKMNGEPTIFGPRTFTPELHHQNNAEYRIIEVQNGKAGVVGTWTLSEPIPLEALLN